MAGCDWIEIFAFFKNNIIYVKITIFFLKTFTYIWEKWGCGAGPWTHHWPAVTVSLTSCLTSMSAVRTKSEFNQLWRGCFWKIRVCLTWKCAPGSGRCRLSTSGVFEPLTGSEDRQTAENGHGCVVGLLLASNTTDNTGKILVKFRPYWSDKYSSRALILWICHRQRWAGWASRASVWWQLIFSWLTGLISLLYSVQMSQTGVGVSYVSD